MSTLPAQTAHEAAHEGTFHIQGPSVGWFLRRSLLWVLIVASAVGAACLLYAAAGGDGAQPVEPFRAKARIADQPLKV